MSVTDKNAFSSRANLNRLPLLGVPTNGANHSLMSARVSAAGHPFARQNSRSPAHRNTINSSCARGLFSGVGWLLRYRG